MGGLLFKVIVVLALWFCVIQPFLFGSYNRVMALYWWMQP